MKRIFAITVLIGAAFTVAVGQEFRPIPNPPGELLEALKNAGNFNTLISLLEVAGYFEAASKGKGRLTLLAPNDEAFAKFSSDEIESLKKNPEKAQAFLKAHTLLGKVICPPMNRGSGKARSVNVKNLAGSQVSIVDTSFSITDTSQASNVKSSLKPGSAGIMDTSVTQSSSSGTAGILDTSRPKGPRAAQLLRNNLEFSGGLIQEINAALVAPR